MKRTILVFAILGGFPLSALAGEIFGLITEADRPVAGARVAVTVAGKTYTTDSDARGSYRVVVPASGKARLMVTAGSRALSIDVFSSERPVRCDLVITPGPNPQLRRR
jgi:hypothetical protein